MTCLSESRYSGVYNTFSLSNRILWQHKLLTRSTKSIALIVESHLSYSSIAFQSDIYITGYIRSLSNVSRTLNRPLLEEKDSYSEKIPGTRVKEGRWHWVYDAAFRSQIPQYLQRWHKTTFSAVNWLQTLQWIAKRYRWAAVRTCRTSVLMKMLAACRLQSQYRTQHSAVCVLMFQCCTAAVVSEKGSALLRHQNTLNVDADAEKHGLGQSTST